MPIETASKCHISSSIPQCYLYLHLFSFIIDCTHNKAHIKATEYQLDRLASSNVVTPLTTLSVLGSNHHC